MSSRKPLGEQLYDELCRDIIHERLPAGTNLMPERKLSSSRGLNRGAVREAIKRLAQMRLIRTTHGGGNRVENWREVAGLELLPDLLVNETGLPNFSMLRSLLEFRASLAVDAARLAAERAGTTLAHRLQLTVDLMRKRPNDLESQQVLVQDFWADLVRGSGNQVYVMAFNSLDACWLRYGAHLRHLLSDELKAIAHYQAIIESCKKQSPEAAARQASLLLQLARAQIERAATGLEQRQAINNGDLFSF